MTRRRGDQGFTKNEVRRLMKIADEEGWHDCAIKISTENGRPAYMLIRHGREAAIETDTNLKDLV